MKYENLENTLNFIKKMKRSLMLRVDTFKLTKNANQLICLCIQIY